MGMRRSRVRRTVRSRLRQPPMQRKRDCSERRRFPFGCRDSEGPGRLWEMTLGQGLVGQIMGCRREVLKKRNKKH